MQDPFRDPNNKSFQREVQMWMAALICLMAVFVYFAVRRISGTDYTVPDHILRSGIAKTIRSSDSADVVASINNSPEFRGGSNGHHHALKRLNAPTIPPSKFHGSTFAVDRAKSNRPPSLNRSTSSQTQPAPSADQRIAFQQISPIKIQPQSSAAKPAAVTAPAKLRPRKSTAGDPNAFDASKFENSVKFAADEANVGVQRLAKLAAMTQAIPKRIAGLQRSIDVAQTNFEQTDNKSAEAKQQAFQPPRPKSADPKPAIQIASKKSSPAVSKAAFDIQANDAPSTSPISTAAKRPSNVFEPPKSLSPLVPKTLSPIAIEPKVPKPDLNTQVSTTQPLSTASQPLPSLRPDTDFAIESIAANKKLIPSVKQPSVEKAIQAKPTPKFDRHSVADGDSFFSIAQQRYGDGRYFEALYLANRDRVRSFDDLPVGVEIEIPKTTELRQRFPKSCASISDPANSPSEAESRIYSTRDGDTLFDIARRRLGQASRYVELIQHNEFRLPAEVGPSDKLPENLRLVLPR